MDLEALCGEHHKQYDAVITLLNDPSQYQGWRCSRRAAKTYGMAITGAEIATTEPGTNIIYAALTRGQAKEAMWRTTWKPFIERNGLTGSCKHNETNQQTIFENGSSVAFGGLDDLKHIQTFLGQKLRLFMADESQGAPSSLLKALVEDVISPALSDDKNGKFLLAGMLPDIPAGYYYDAITKGRWLFKNWNRFDNPFLREDQHKALAEWLKVTGLSIDSPETRRRWFGELVFDPAATAYRYDKAKNAYSPPWPRDLFHYSMGIDPGTRDRTAIVVFGWNTLSRDIYQIHEWVTSTNSGTRWSDIIAEVKRINGQWPLSYCFYDAGGSMMELDLFTRDSGIPVLKAANKNDLPGQVSRASDLLATGRLHILDGSALEKDFQLSRWNTDARVEGRFEWSSDNHPDVADAARYALGGYYDSYTAPDVRTFEERLADDEKERIQGLLDASRTGLDMNDQLGRILGINEPG